MSACNGNIYFWKLVAIMLERDLKKKKKIKRAGQRPRPYNKKKPEKEMK